MVKTTLLVLNKCIAYRVMPNILFPYENYCLLYAISMCQYFCIYSPPCDVYVKVNSIWTMDFGLLELNLSINSAKRSVPKQFLQHWIELVAMECLGIELMFPII